jgi:hypothetical protein
MARLTRRAGVLAGELEGRPVVVELVVACNGAVGAFVLGVTAAARRPRRHGAVQRLVAVDLGADVGVAVKALARHGVAAPRRHMTCGTAALELRVRSHAAQRHVLSGLGAEPAGAEHLPAGGEDAHAEAGQREQHADPGRGMTSQEQGAPRHFSMVE